MSQEKILRLVRETAAMRRDLLDKGIEEGSLTVELSNRDLSAIVYSLACTWISEYVAASPGWREMMEMVSGASETILSADAAPQIDRAIDQILGRGEAADGGSASGRHNPEVDGDGA